MESVRIFKIEVRQGFYACEVGCGFSLAPWGGNTAVYEGTDDGGRVYNLPVGFMVAESQSLVDEIYDAKGNLCKLASDKKEQPVLICSDGRRVKL